MGRSGVAMGNGAVGEQVATGAPAAAPARRRAVLERVLDATLVVRPREGAPPGIGLRAALPLVVTLVAVGVPLLRCAWAAADGQLTWFGADADQMELRVLAASHGRLTLGAFSVYGWQHPGPALFYWLAPFYALAGETPAGMVIGTVTANVAGLVLLVFLLRRWAGEVAGWVAVAGAAAFGWRFGLEGLWVPWNPTLTVVPMALLLVALAGLAAGHRWALPLVAALASWLVQAHLGTALVVSGLTLTTGAVLAWRARGAGQLRAGVRAWRAPVLAAVGVAGVLWAAPLADQVAGTHNLTTVARYLATGEIPEGAAPNGGGGRAFTPGQAVAEVGLVGSLTTGREPGRFAGPDRPEAWRTATTGASTAAFALLLAANAALGAAGHRNGRRFGPALCGAVVAAGLLAYLSALLARGGPSHHVVAFAAGIGLVAWLAAAIEVAALVSDARRRRRPVPRPAGAPGTGRATAVRATAVALAALAVAASTASLARRDVRLMPPPARVLQPMVAEVERVGDGTIVLDTPGVEATLLHLVLALRRDGYDVRVPPYRQVSFTREQFMPATWDTSVWVGLAGRRPPGTGWYEVATVLDPYGDEVVIHARPGPR